MKVLQLLGPSTGGIRRHVAYLSHRLRLAGWDVAIAGPPGVLDGLDVGFPVALDVEVDVPGGIDPRAVVRARRQLRDALSDVDIVHAHGLKAGWIASSIPDRPPLVVSVHNLVLDDVAGRSAAILRWLEARLPARADATIAISGPVEARFTGVDGHDRITVIPPAGPPPAPKRPPQEVRAALGLRPDDDLVVTAARLHPQKGLDTLLAAAALVARARPGARWFVFGDGPDGERFRAAIEDQGLAQVVFAPGARPSVDDELAAADVVAVTSTWESGPLVVLEAIASGRPVVSTRVGLAPDVLVAPRGAVVDVGDAEGLARAIVAMLVDPPSETAEMPSSPGPMQPPALAAAVESVYRSVLAP